MFKSFVRKVFIGDEKIKKSLNDVKKIFMLKERNYGL